MNSSVMKAYKLSLTGAERQQLKQSKCKINELHNYAADEISALLYTTAERAREIAALIEFQQVPSIGPRFAADLISIGCYSLRDLKDKQGPELLNLYERSHGFRVDPCVEDQFWLVVHFANNGGHKNWWDFTPLRKAYREQHGYPSNRPGN
jgi:hypothetical protein